MPRFSSRIRAVVVTFAALVAACVVATGCAKAAEEKTVLQADDLTTDPELKFDKNEILDPASFTDTTQLDVSQIDDFLRHTPYRRACFLETYQSNGVPAEAAIMNSANKYRINPLVFLVRLEMAQGLIGEQFYPFPPARVEYVFGCGCANATTCAPDLAGLDRQLDCLGRALRTSLDEIKANGQTAGGWGPNKTLLTVDGQKVTPGDESTAALYQYAPVVGQGKSGNWLFWNIWQKYSTALDYQAPVGGGPGAPTAWIGDPCTADPLCDYEGGICLNDARTPGGMCTLDCTNADCPNNPDHPATFCASFSNGGSTTGRCLPVCNPGAPACRQGYKCIENVPKYNGAPSDAKSVCFNQ
jgi:hypothetical protein